MLSALVRSLKQSFSAKIVALVVLSVLVTSAVVGYATVRSTKQFLAAKTSEKFPSVLSGTKARIMMWFDRRIGELTALSESEPFVTAFRTAAASPDDGVPKHGDFGIEFVVAQFKQKSPSFSALVLFDGEGNLVTATDEEAVAEAREARDVLAATDHPAGYSPHKKLGGTLKVYYWLYVPFFGATPGALLAQVDTEEFTDLLHDMNLSVGSDLYLLDGEGCFVTQPRGGIENLVGATAMQVPIRHTGRVLVDTKHNTFGRKVFSSMIKLEDPGWWLVYEEDYNVAMAPALNSQRRVWYAVLIIVGIGIMVALRIVKSILRPVRSLSLGARRINEGLVGVEIPRGSNDEIGMMIDTFNEMAKTITLSKAELQYKNKMLNSQNDQLQDMNRKLEELSITDGLTGLYNHRHFWSIMNKDLSRVNRYQGELALILVDLDDFKRINDRFGHAVGDVLLQSLARIFERNVRETDIVARYGGEEFAILLPDTDRQGVENVSEKLRSSVETMRFQVPETDIVIPVTISIGVSVFRGDRRDFFNAADKALYRSKDQGKNRVNFAVDFA